MAKGDAFKRELSAFQSKRKNAWTPWVPSTILCFSLTEERTCAEKPGKQGFEASVSSADLGPSF